MGLTNSYPNFVVTASFTVNDDVYNGRTIVSQSTAPITITFPANVMANFSCVVVQDSTCIVTTAAGTGATLNSVYGFTGTSGRYSAIGIIAISDGNMILVGDGA